MTLLETALEREAHRRQELGMAMLLAVKPTDRALAGWGLPSVGVAWLKRLSQGEEAE